jgi:hypothetical protein
MAAIQQMLASFKVAVVNVYATWNPADAAANVTLSNGNLTVGHTGNQQGTVRSTISKSTGKWYWELTIGLNNDTNGVATSGAALSTRIGTDAFGWGYFPNGTSFSSGANPAYGAAYTSGDVIGVAMDASGGTVTMYKNNVSQGIMYSSVGVPIFAANSLVSSSGVTTANFGASPFTYTPPAGYNAGLY